MVPLRQLPFYSFAIALLAGCTPAGVRAQSLPPEHELIAALAAVRARGCAGGAATPSRLQRVAELDRAAQRVAQGEPPMQATRNAGYRAVRLYQASMSGYRSVRDVAQAMAQSHCKAVTDPVLTDVGFYQRGNAYWVVVAARFNPPPASAGADVAARVLALVNEARSQARKCGNESFAPSGPLKPNALLDRAAAAHAQDMARHGYLEHKGRDGSGPAERASRAGYPWRSIGENIASGQATPEAAVQAWLRSPGHCANLMNARFTEMGLAYAVNNQSEFGIYWAQSLGRPR